MTSIYIDMDDVLSASYQTFLHVLEREFGKKLDYTQITEFDLQKTFGLSDDEYSHFFDCIHNPDEMIQHAPVTGANELVCAWHDKGYDISILTGRPIDTQEVSLKWLTEHNFPYKTFSIVNKYGRDSSEGQNSMSLKTLSEQTFDLAVEDSGQMAKFLSETMNVTVALLDRPWNQSMSFNNKVHRCADWTEIKEKFGRL
jgi:uncharacterized HAD superfamily protein